MSRLHFNYICSLAFILLLDQKCEDWINYIGLKPFIFSSVLLILIFWEKSLKIFCYSLLSYFISHVN